MQTRQKGDFIPTMVGYHVWEGGCLMTVHFVSSPSAVSFLSIVRVGTFLRLLHPRHRPYYLFPHRDPVVAYEERESEKERKKEDFPCHLMNCCVREEQHPRLITSLRLKNWLIETMQYQSRSYVGNNHVCQKPRGLYWTLFSNYSKKMIYCHDRSSSSTGL